MVLRGYRILVVAAGVQALSAGSSKANAHFSSLFFFNNIIIMGMMMMVVDWRRRIIKYNNNTVINKMVVYLILNIIKYSLLSNKEEAAGRNE